MKSVYDTKDKCCGCSACAQICPKQCIKMMEDEEGFIFPSINTKDCVDCGLCRNVCIFHNPIKKFSEGDCYVYVNFNFDKRINSSSSGAFETICQYFSKRVKTEDIIVFGCVMDNDLRVRHKYVLGNESLDCFKKSKYIQSSINSTFKEVQKFLEKGKYVIFSGTPCQIAGLKMFLRKDYERLLLIDLICHGVPSQFVFDKYLKYLERTKHSKVKEYHFRYKEKNSEDIWSNLNVSIKYENGMSEVLNNWEDPFMRSFLDGLMFRKSCYSCPFTSVERVSDITVGDFWGIDEFDAQLSEKVTNGTSLILFNTEKGRCISEDMLSIENGYYNNVPLEIALRFNGQLSHPQRLNVKRKLFFSKIRGKNGFSKAIRNCYPLTYGKKHIFLRTIYTSNVYQFLSRLKNYFSH